MSFKKTLFLLLITANSLFALESSVNSQSGIRVLKHGPNCFNTALQGAKLIDGFRFVSGSEFSFLMTSKLCKAINPSDQKPGDILAYQRNIPSLTNENIYAHAATYSGEGLYFNKLTQYMTSSVQLASKDQIDQVYLFTSPVLRFPVKNKNDNNRGCGDNGNCENSLKFFRCASLEKKLKKFDSNFFVSYKKIERAFDQAMFRLPEVISDEALFQEIRDISSMKNKICKHGSKNFECLYYEKFISSLNSQMKYKQPDDIWYQEFLKIY